MMESLYDRAVLAVYRETMRQNFSYERPSTILADSQSLVDGMASRGFENVDLFKHSLKYARQESQLLNSHFDMDVFLRGSETLAFGQQPQCGSTMCLAGTAVWLSLKPDQLLDMNRDSLISGGDTVSISLAAIRSLGINSAQSEVFYLTEATIDELVDVCSWICGEQLDV